MSHFDVETEVDNIIAFENHYNIAMLIFKILRDKYYFKKEWFFKEDGRPDTKGASLIFDIKNMIADIFIARANHWEKQELSQEDEEMSLQSKFRSARILHVANKLKNNDRFVKDILTELKTFFSNN